MSQHGKGNKCQRGVKYQTGKYVTVWEEGHSETDREIVSEWMFCHIPVKKEVVLTQLYYINPPGVWVDVISLGVLSGVEMSQ